MFVRIILLAILGLVVAPSSGIAADLPTIILDKLSKDLEFAKKISATPVPSAVLSLAPRQYVICLEGTVDSFRTGFGGVDRDYRYRYTVYVNAGRNCRNQAVLVRDLKMWRLTNGPRRYAADSRHCKDAYSCSVNVIQDNNHGNACFWAGAHIYDDNTNTEIAYLKANNC